MLVYMYASVQVCKCTSMQVYKYANVQVCKCTSVQMYKCASIQVCKCTSMLPGAQFLVTCKNLDMVFFFNCSNLDIWVFDIWPVCKKASMQVYWYTSILVYKNTRMYAANSSILFDFVIDNQLEILACWSTTYLIMLINAKNFSVYQWFVKERWSTAFYNND